MNIGATLDAPRRSPLTRTQRLVPLADAFDERIAGGKASTLARLMALSVPVPEGVVLTCQAFESFLGSSSVRERIDASLESLENMNDPVAVARVSSAIHALVISSPLPLEVDEALVSVAASPLGAGTLVVRSSAIGEDGTRSSFAGQFDSVLHVSGLDSLRHAVRACWASCWSARALFYRQAKGLQTPGMAVIIQRQVDAAVAGVIFTMDPDGRGDVAEMVVEYVSGLAHRLVAGEIDPDRVYLSRATCAISRETPAEGGIAAKLLTAKQLSQLGAAGMRLEQVLGGPQDIEWAIDKHGELAVVQSRGITTLDAHRAQPSLILWSNANVNENFPEPVSPLLYSIASVGYYHYFRNLGLAFGVSRRRLAAMDSALRTIVGVHGARMYYNLTNIHAVLRMAPFGDRLADAFNLFVGADQTAHQPANATSWRDRRGRTAQALELVRIAWAVAWQFLFLRRRLKAFERNADRFAARTTYEALKGRTRALLGDNLAEFIDIRCRRWKNASLCDTAAMVCYALLRRCLAREGFGDATHTRLLRALPDVPSSQPALRLWALSRAVNADEALRTLVTTSPAPVVLETIRTTPRFAGFRRQLDDFLTDWGFRSSGELMLTTPTLEEQPEPVLSLLRQYVEVNGESPETTIARQAAERRCEASRILRTLVVRAPARAALTWLLLRSTQIAVACRERARLKQALLYTRCRRVALSIGDSLVSSGQLETPADVFMLTWQELDELCAGRAMFPRGVAALVETRRTQHAVESRLNPPDTFFLPEGAAFTHATARRRTTGSKDATDDSLHGTTACGGCATGPAAVLAGVHEAYRLNKGDVLVTRQTDPGWAPVFCLVAGLVIERGGMLSHGAIIAREFGLPCVVGVKDATSRIPHGATLTVNGDLAICTVEAAQ